MKSKKIRKTANIYAGGGFSSFLNSGALQNMIGMMGSMGNTNQSNQPSTGQSSTGWTFLDANRSSAHGSGMMGTIGSSIDMTGQLISAIDQMTKKPRKPITQVIGLTNQYASGGSMGAMDYMNMGQTAMALAGNAMQQAYVPDTTGITEAVQAEGKKPINATSYDDLYTDYANRRELQHISWKDLRNNSLLGDFANSLSASAQGFSSGSSAGPWGAAIGGALGGISSVVGSLVGRRKAKKRAKSLNAEIDKANELNLLGLENAAANIGKQNNFNTLASTFANGGYMGPLEYDLMNSYLNNNYLASLADNKITSLPNSYSTNIFRDGGGIHIAPSKRGTFTAAAKKHGKGVQEFARQVLANKDNYSPAMVKKANFARNAAKWKHENGGPLVTQGGIWDNGVTTVNNGGSHETNPNEGIQMGVDYQGIPNLVEEGEVVWNDFVFSNRIQVPDSVKKELGVKGKNITFADAAKQLQKESSERPNDPISKNGLDASLTKLTIAHEAVRNAKNTTENNKMAMGGLKNKFEDGSTIVTSTSGNTDLTGAYEPEGSSGMGIGDTSKYNWTGYLQFAPMLGSLVGLGMSLKPANYREANALIDMANEMWGDSSYGQYDTISPELIGNYLSYTPLDRDYYLNKLASQAAATKNTIIENSGGNRANAIAGLLAADYNSQLAAGNLARLAEEENFKRRNEVETFNRVTNQANADAMMKAAMANQSSSLTARKTALEARKAAMDLMSVARQRRQDLYEQRRANILGNLTNLFNSIGDFGKQTVESNMANAPYDYSINPFTGKTTYKGASNSGAFGGYLTTGLTTKRRYKKGGRYA